MYLVGQNDKYLDVEKVKLFNNYYAAQTYFYSLVGEFMLMFITDKELELRRDGMGMWDGKGNAIEDLPYDEEGFGASGESITCNIDEETSLFMKWIEVEKGV